LIRALCRLLKTEHTHFAVQVLPLQVRPYCYGIVRRPQPSKKTARMVPGRIERCHTIRNGQRRL
jgi:hypothetical protein